MKKYLESLRYQQGNAGLRSVAILNSVGSFVNPVFCCPKTSPRNLVTCAEGQVTPRLLWRSR